MQIQLHISLLYLRLNKKMPNMINMTGQSFSLHATRSADQWYFSAIRSLNNMNNASRVMMKAGTKPLLVHIDRKIRATPIKRTYTAQ